MVVLKAEVSSGAFCLVKTEGGGELCLGTLYPGVIGPGHFIRLPLI